MDLLYHGSSYLQAELMPGFKRSGVFVQWDRIENNHFLYASTQRDSAIGLGLSSAFEKMAGVNRYEFDGKNMIIDTDTADVTLEAVYGLAVYLYTLPHRDGDGWEKNFNPFNNILTEYKTVQTVELDTPAEQIDLKKWFSDKKLTLTRRQLSRESVTEPIYYRW